jgi:hypothetical protein
MTEPTKQNEWTVFVLSDPSTHPEDESDVEWEFAEGIRAVGRYSSYSKQIRFHEDNPHVPKQRPPNDVQRWRYDPRE